MVILIFGDNEDEATVIRYSFIDNAYLAGPDVLERVLAFNPSAADGNADRDSDGMTNLEDWLAERALQ